MTAVVCAHDASDSAVSDALERALASQRPGENAVVELSRRFFDYSSSYTIETLDARLADGTVLELVLKDLSPESLLPDARSRPAFAGDPEREIAAYTGFLSWGPPGPPALFGTSVDFGRGRYWLFLERVDGLQLQHVGELSVWTAAAEWLGRFHAAFSSDETTVASLPVRDDTYYRYWLDRACAFAAGGRPHTDARRLQRLADRFDVVTRRLAAMPATVVHGDFCAANIVVAQARDSVRICPVDWERSAVGPAMVDLAALTAGSWTPGQQETLVAAYESASGRPVDRTDLALCRLQLALQWAGWSESWVPPLEYARDWLGLALNIAEEVGL